jgi:hypothetical protein
MTQLSRPRVLRPFLILAQQSQIERAGLTWRTQNPILPVAEKSQLQLGPRLPLAHLQTEADSLERRLHELFSEKAKPIST